ncbi:brachyurin [Zeugodacus cucurbitae]|uniref:brachyurin n=1 Tax=Zeugodacus cucurbitae TaxID=28588 RepID=UPI000596A39D|nr:brachyurin [Zeugodacus cucurbitae]
MSYLTVFIVICAITAVAASESKLNWSTVVRPHMNPADAIQPKLHERNFGARIINGEIAGRKQFPYQAGLEFFTLLGGVWCGGSIISDRWIIGAAHCTEALIAGVNVYVGAFNRLDRKEAGQHVIYVTRKHIILHENYDDIELTNDLVLIKLPVPLEFTEFIQPVKLPKREAVNESFENEIAIASGWGIISDDDFKPTDILRWIDVPIISNTECNSWIYGSIHSTNICIGTDNYKSTCHGDAGGPLVLAKDSTLIGVASYNIIYSCEIGGPAPFTRVTSYLDWIEAKTGISSK